MMKSIFNPFVWLFYFFTLYLSLTGCGKESNSSTTTQQIPTNQIVIIQTTPSGGGGTGGGGMASGISISSVSLPQSLFQSTAVTFLDPGSGQAFIYVLGGAYYDPNYPDPINVDTVYSNLIQSDGTLSPIWGVGNNPRLPVKLRGHSTVIYKNEIYVMGGIGVFGFRREIYKADIIMNKSVTPSVPVLNQWKLVGYLPVAETGQASVVSGDMLYVIGGIESGLPDFNTCSPNCVGSQTTVFSDKIYGYNLLSFSTTPDSIFTMKKKLYTPAAIALPASQIWVLGGWDGDANANSDTAYSFNIYNGTLSPGLACYPCPLPYGGVSKAIGLYMPDIQQMVLMGGVSGSFTTPEVIRQEIYSALDPSLTSLGVPAWSADPSLPNPVGYFSATSSGSFIYVFGGLVNRTS